MSTITDDQALKPLHKILSRLTGQERFDMALHLATKDLLQLKMNEADHQLQEYENRYGMSFEEFRDAWENDNLPDRHSYEIEKDYWEWEAAFTDRERLQEMIAEIQ
jgi:hypothetical protein